VTVAPGTSEATSAHIRLRIERLRVVNRQLKDAHHQLDTLCGLLAEPTESEPGARGFWCGAIEMQLTTNRACRMALGVTHGPDGTALGQIDEHFGERHRGLALAAVGI
jgi:hypothetical protein